MSITAAMQTGVSGLLANGEAISVIGNNLANVNTVGFKEGRTLFSDMLSSNINRGQIGRGSQIQAVQNMFSQGSLESTGSATDLAIQGDGMFVLQDPATTSRYYSRAGAFTFDKNNILTNADGYKVLGFGITNGVSNGVLGKIDQSQFATIAAKGTTSANVVANLDATSNPPGATASNQVAFSGNLDPASAPVLNTTVYDANGVAHAATITFTAPATPAVAPANDVWQWSMNLAGATPAAGTITGTATFSPFTAANAAATPPVAEVLSQFLSQTQSTNTVTINGVPQNISVNLGALTDNPLTASAATGAATMTANGSAALAFDPSNPINTSNFSTTMATYDSLGAAQTTSLYYSKTGANTWSVSAMRNGALLGSPSTVTFDPATGAISSGTKLSFGNYNVDITGTTQFASTSTVTSQNQDGYPSGSMVKVSVDENGFVNVLYSNSQTQKVAQIALAKFASLQGLDKAGGNMFQETVASGQAIVDPSNLSSNKVIANSLEQSNVDMADQLVKMITTQRSYTANSKTITTADQMIQDTLSIIR